jgi:hypothetical protein
MNHEAAYKYLTGGEPHRCDAPCCPWGRPAEFWTEAAIGLAELYAKQDGSELSADHLDTAASVVVNAGDMEAWELHLCYPESVPAPVYPFPLDSADREAIREEGREAGRAAGSWAADGNTDPDHADLVLTMMRDGVPEAYDYLPTLPDLSGELADSPTVRSLAENLGLADALDACPELGDEIAELWEEGRDETFEPTCEAELIAALN